MSYNAILEIPNVVVVSGPAGQSFRPVDDVAELTADFGRDGDRAIIRADGDEWLKTAGMWAATGENFWGTLLEQGAAQVDAATEQAGVATEGAQATAADRVQTGQDRTATGLDRVATGQDRAATGEDRVATGQDRTATGLDRQATAADRAAVQSKFNHTGGLQRLPQQAVVQPIILGANGGTLLGMRLSDGKAILNLASESVEIAPENVGVLRAIDRAVAIPGRGLHNYVGVDARKPIIAGKNGGVLAWLDTSVDPPTLSGAFTLTGVQYQALFPNDLRGRVSDYAEIVEQSVETLRFIRPVNDGNNFQHCAPGARVGYITTAQYMQLDVHWNNLVTRLDTYNTICAILVDGVLHSTFSSGFAPGTPGDQSYTFDFGSVGLRKVEIVWCYAAGMELRQTRFSANAALAIADARPTKILNVHGDSTTHGMTASSIVTTWSFGLAADLGRQLLNTANGSNTAVASQGALVAQAILDTGIADAKALYSIGINDCITNRVPTAAFKTAVEGYLAGFRGLCPTVPMVFCGAFYCPAHETAHTYPLQDYRDVLQAIVVAAADPNLTYVDGKTLMVNSADRLVGDQTHPNDLGCSEIRTNLFAHF